MRRGGKGGHVRPLRLSATKAATGFCRWLPPPLLAANAATSSCGQSPLTAHCHRQWGQQLQVVPGHHLSPLRLPAHSPRSTRSHHQHQCNRLWVVSACRHHIPATDAAACWWLLCLPQPQEAHVVHVRMYRMCDSNIPA